MFAKLQRMLAVSIFGMLMLSPNLAAALPVGPGISIANDALDTADNIGRINIDDSAEVLLGAGWWQATFFNFDAGRAGSVTPFLAKLNGNNSYEVLLIGASQTLAGAALNQTVSFGSSSLFFLSSATTVYAGIATYQGPNPIYFDDGTTGGIVTDHDNSGLDALILGGTIDGFSHPDLGRRYAFSIDVATVPEPTSIALLGIALLGLGFSRRQNR